MKTINELWDELTNHPDYVTGSLWTVDDVAAEFDWHVEQYFEFDLELEEIDYEDVGKYSLDIVKQNIQIFKNTIEEYQSHLELWNWEVSIYDLVLPEFEVAEKV
jgi:hypothetical protein